MKHLILVLLIVSNMSLFYVFFDEKGFFWAGVSGLAAANSAILTLAIVWFGLSQLNAARKQLTIANDQLRIAKISNIRLMSHNAYSEYLKLTLQFPQFANPDSFSIESDRKLYSHYRWFIANMLFYFEEVLLANDKDKNWGEAITSQIKIHHWHFTKGQRYKNQGWSDELVALIDKTLSISYSFALKRTGVTLDSDNCNQIYTQYLNFISFHSGFYRVERKDQDSMCNDINFVIFLKTVFFLLGSIRKCSDIDNDWVKTVEQELKSFSWIFDERYTRLIKIEDVVLAEHRVFLGIDKRFQKKRA